MIKPGMTDLKPPLRVGETVKLKIERLVAGGEGLGRYQSFTVFVEGGIPEEDLEIKITEVKARYARGKIIKIIKSSPERLAPSELVPSSIEGVEGLAPSSTEGLAPGCEVAGACGGCQWLHIKYAAQLKYKTEIVREALTRLGGISEDLLRPIRGAEHPFFYRNKIQYPAGLEGNQLIMGYYRQGSHRLVDIRQCAIAHPYLTLVANLARMLFRQYSLPVYNEKTGKGLLRHLIGRINFKTGEILLGIVINGEELPYAGTIVPEIVARTKQILPQGGSRPPRIAGIVLNLNPKKTNVILGNKSEVLFGSHQLIDQLNGLRLEVSLPSFFQINPYQTPVIYRQVEEYVEPTGREVIIDAYSGVGAIALWLAPKVRVVIGIEENAVSLSDARHNARLNKARNCQFEEGKAEGVLRSLKDEGIVPDAIILDPPRQGCSPKAIEAVIDINPPKVIYVSCDPATLARDLKLFSGAGYSAEEVQPIDMFPHTFHVEAVARMVRKETGRAT